MNTIYMYKNYAMMIITSKGENHRVYVDLEDVKLVKQYKWHISSAGYVYSSKDKILLHRLIVQHHSNYSKEDLQNLDIDHADNNPLNNTKKNLRVSTRSENCRNRQPIGKSGVLNIRWIKDRGSWKVEFKGHSKNFKDFFTAFDYRNKKAKELYGEYAFIQEQIEVYTTTDLREVGKLEANGFHYIICQSNEICDTFVYVYSHELKELLGHVEEE